MLGALVVLAVSAFFILVTLGSPGVLNVLFDGLDLALGWAGPLVAVTVVSAITGVLFIAAFPHISAQGWIVAVKDRIKHNLLGIRIFQDDLPTVARGVGGSLSWNCVYLGLNLLPMVVMAGPFMVVWFQLNALYAYDPVAQGEEMVVVADLAPGVPAAEIAIVLPPHAELLQRVNMVGKVALRLGAVKEGQGNLRFAFKGQEISKSFHVGSAPRRLARIRSADPWGGFFAARDPILYFGEPVLAADSFLVQVQVPYPTRPLGPFPGGEIPIMVLFVLVSLAVGFGLKGVFGVEI